MQASKGAAPAAVADAGIEDDDPDAYSDYDEMPAGASNSTHTAKPAAKTGKRQMEGALPANQIGAAKRAKAARK